jgi:hypothetical protein
MPELLGNDFSRILLHATRTHERTEVRIYVGFEEMPLMGDSGTKFRSRFRAYDERQHTVGMGGLFGTGTSVECDVLFLTSMVSSFTRH